MLPFDELNILNKKQSQRSIPIDRYFDEMDLPAGEKADRKAFAKKLEDKLFETMALIYTVIERNALGNIPMVIVRLEDELTSLVREYTVPDSEMLDYINEYSTGFVDTTVKYAQYDEIEDENDDIKTSYWFSEDRARYNAENEANTIFNYEQFRQAKADGFTYKRWVTMKDERVRRTHAEVDGVTIPIDEYFQVGDALLLYPKMPCDFPEETVNCRCTLTFL